MKACVQEVSEGIALQVHAQPGAAKTGFGGVRNNELLVRIAAAPRDGEANKELCAFLSRFFHVSKSSVEVVRGGTSRHKAVLIRGDASQLLSHIHHLLA
jgi:uncharacterized protein (TIGR00251 family)